MIVFCLHATHKKYFIIYYNNDLFEFQNDMARGNELEDKG